MRGVAVARVAAARVAGGGCQGVAGARVCLALAGEGFVHDACRGVCILLRQPRVTSR